MAVAVVNVSFLTVEDARSLPGGKSWGVPGSSRWISWKTRKGLSPSRRTVCAREFATDGRRWMMWTAWDKR